MNWINNFFRIDLSTSSTPLFYWFKKNSFAIEHYTVYIRDLDKLNLIRQFAFRLKPIFASAPAASKIILPSNVVKSDRKIIKWLLSPRFSLNPWYTLYDVGKIIIDYFFIGDDVTSDDFKWQVDIFSKMRSAG